ncbi:MAG: HNH endonuclease [Actinobacteria bacterium]|nr:MAG: HNH endonuclease [Actinomycetota bacterium]
MPWQGRPIPNGVPNRLENLLLLCPNCHSQTENFAGRGVVRPIRPVA